MRRQVDPAGPIVVLSYAHAGAETVADVLSASPSLACTSGTGLIPACHAAVAAWRAIERADTGPSALAVKSVRMLATVMMASIQAGAGASRWCETSTAAPAAAATFLRIFPSATMICLHRQLAAVLAEGMAAHPWGLGGSPFWPYAGSHPGNNVATIASYWVAFTESLLEFEEGHSHCTMRIKYEDLTGQRDQTVKAIYEFLGVEDVEVPAPSVLREIPVARYDDATFAEQLQWLPEQLRRRVDSLHMKLGYAR